VITIVAQCRVKPGRKAEFLAAAVELIRGSRSDDGNVSFHLYEDIEHPEILTFIEEWKSPEAIREHGGSSYLRHAGARLAPCIEGNLIINQYRRID